MGFTVSGDGKVQNGKAVRKRHTEVQYSGGEGDQGLSTSDVGNVGTFIVSIYSTYNMWDPKK